MALKLTIEMAVKRFVTARYSGDLPKCLIMAVYIAPGLHLNAYCLNDDDKA